MSRSFRSTSVVGLAALALTLGACGGDDAPARPLQIDAAADDSLRFERAAISAPAARAVIQMANPAQIDHAIGIRGPDAAETGETVGTGEVSQVEVDLKPGRYTLFCPVPGHEQAGMAADLTVR